MPAKQDAGDEFERAATAIWDTEYLVVIAGPSFYESSERTVFSSELCDHTLLQTSPEKFYGFWGEYSNRYANRAAHDGYGILRKWRDNYFDAYGSDLRRKGGPLGGTKNKEEGDEEVLQRCYVVTATIDGSFGRAGFPRDEIYELCGNITYWQCWIPCKPEVWQIDPHFRFDVDSELREAKPIKWVQDNRPNVLPEVWTVLDSDEEGSEEEELPPLFTDKASEKLGKDASRKTRDDRKREPPPLGKLGHATPIQLHVVTQEVYPNMNGFVDRFAAAPSSNHMPVPTFMFPKRHSEGDEPSGDAEHKPSGPEQPYLLAPRVNHCLNHLIGLYTQKYSYHVGTFDYHPVNWRKVMRRNIWQTKQRFFDPVVPDGKRKQHIYYNISLMISDANSSGVAPALLAFGPHHAAGAEVEANGDAPLFPPLQQRSSSMQRLETPVSPAPQSTRSAAAIPVGSPTSGATGDVLWHQGREGKYYFSYVPISSTHADPDEILYDTLHIEFPPEALPNTLPRRGKVSIIVECCEFPEPKPKETSSEPKKDKKKKEEPNAPSLLKLDPIPEPTVYTVTQLLGRFSHPTTKRTEMPQSNVPYKINDIPSLHAEQPDDFVYTLTTRKGHAVDIGSNYNDPSTISFIEIEVPVANPAARDPMKGPVHCEKVDTRASTMLSKKKKKGPRPVPNWQRCTSCGEFARPNVVMDPKKDMRAIVPSKKQYQQWETSMNKALRGAGASLVILEVGCEKKMDVSRKLSEKLFKLTKASGKCTFIRLAAEDLEKKAKGNQADSDKMINIVGPILNSLVVIDRRMQEMKRRK